MNEETLRSKSIKAMQKLYPLRFDPILKSKVWGGNRLEKKLGKQAKGLTKIGESWELSSVPNELSIVSEGYLKGKNITQIIEEYKEQIVGDKTYKKFGTQFPLLIKFIDANDYLSVQVHPDDELAKARHNSFGKTEMWYVVDAEKDAELIVGFNKEISKENYLKYFEMDNLLEILNREKVKKDDVFYLPAGRVHATGPGILFAEIQQASDITYRVYDWDRKDDEGNSRELHTELALGALNFDLVDEYKTKYLEEKNKSCEIIDSDYFTTNILSINKELTCNYSNLDSFVILMAVDGISSISFSDDEPPLLLKMGETILIPAAITNIRILPISKTSRLLETHM